MRGKSAAYLARSSAGRRRFLRDVRSPSLAVLAVAARPARTTRSSTRATTPRTPSRPSLTCSLAGTTCTRATASASARASRSRSSTTASCRQINNSVAIGFGLDLLHYDSCWYNAPCSANYIHIPVVMQWNFYVAQRWSVFGEPGLVIFHGFFEDCPPNVNRCNGSSARDEPRAGPLSGRPLPLQRQDVAHDAHRASRRSRSASRSSPDATRARRSRDVSPSCREPLPQRPRTSTRPVEAHDRALRPTPRTRPMAQRPRAS